MVRMLKLAAGLLALTALLATGCRETLNVGTVALPTWDTVASFTVQVTVPGNARGGETGNFTVNITGGTAPFEITYTFDDCVTPRTHSSNITGRADQLTVTFDEVTTDTTCLLTVSVTDAANRTGTRERTFTLRPGTPAGADTAPTITDITFDDVACTATVSATDAEGDDITINVTTTAGLNVDAASQAVTGGTAVFTFSADDAFAGATGTATFTATANGLSSASEDLAVDCPAIVLADDTLYAIPQQVSAATGEEMTIVVVTGTPAFPFHFMNAVRVTFPAASGVEYVDDSFNVGAIGGARDAVDGIWTAVNPGGFLLGSDSFIVERSVDTFTVLDFNVTPLGGDDVTTASGALFNFGVTFANAGTWEIGFQEADFTLRTYYTDSTETPQRPWGDIGNDHTGVANTVTVN